LTKSKLASGRLGTKRQCLACGAKYYDLGRQPPVCSRCGARAEPKRAGEQAGAQAADEEKVAKAQRSAAPIASPARPIGREWSPEQAQAIDAVGRWLKTGEPQVFRLFGRRSPATSPKARAATRPSPPSPAKLRW
jgi:ribosomal protein L40E